MPRRANWSVQFGFAMRRDNRAVLGLHIFETRDDELYRRPVSMRERRDPFRARCACSACPCASAKRGADIERVLCDLGALGPPSANWRARRRCRRSAQLDQKHAGVVRDGEQELAKNSRPAAAWLHVSKSSLPSLVRPSTSPPISSPNALVDLLARDRRLRSCHAASPPRSSDRRP